MDAAPNTDDAPLVALVGRPNVGKSALFNRLTRTRRALVEPLAGTTRDRLYGWFDWRGRRVRVVDTGGMEGADADPFSDLVREQVEQAIDEADAVVFVVDIAEGVNPADEQVADLLRRSDRPVLLVANKADRSGAKNNMADAYSLGLGDPELVSAYHGQGVGDLMDRLLDVLDAPRVERERDERLRLAIVGRPNVGKSSLINAILGGNRVIVSDVPGTTRNAIDSPFTFEETEIVLVDTAGIRRRGRIERGVERHSVAQAEQAIDRADVVLLVIDEQEPRAAQDSHIAGYVAEHGRGLILVVNKWDLAEKGVDRHAFARRVDQHYNFVPWAPVLFTSALTGEGLSDVLEMAIHIGEVRKRRVQTSELNRVMLRAASQQSPPNVQGRRLKLLYVTQAEVEPPTFVFFVNDPELLHFSYRRYLENRLREEFDFTGTAIRMRFRRRSEDRFPEETAARRRTRART